MASTPLSGKEANYLPADFFGAAALWIGVKGTVKFQPDRHPAHIGEFYRTTVDTTLFFAESIIRANSSKPEAQIASSSSRPPPALRAANTAFRRRIWPLQPQVYPAR
ncbi:hypothetical protein KCP73_19000 [Salmonella enterica subsp. enterica]|nr:hypothetical protein KCP73_19000 [Salmonella enterica subsp. enterica]